MHGSQQLSAAGGSPHTQREKNTSLMLQDSGKDTRLTRRRGYSQEYRIGMTSEGITESA